MLSKKSVKVVSIIMMVAMLLMAVGNVAFAVDVPSATGEVSIDSDINAAVVTVLNVMQWIGITAAVIVAMYLGIQYITKAPEGKADIKKNLPIFIGGIVVLLFASAIVTFIKNSLGK